MALIKRKGSSGCCSAIGCSMKRGTNLLSEVKMFSFPRDPTRRAAWSNALKRENWTATNNNLICNAHFVTGRPSRDENHPDYVPSVFNGFHKRNFKRKRMPLKKRKEEKSSVISREAETLLTDKIIVSQQTSKVLSREFSEDLSLEVPSQTSEDWGETQKSGNLSIVDKGLLAKEKIKKLEEDYTSMIFSRVCSLHFQDSDIVREASAYDPKTGRTLTAPLDTIRLKKDAVPSIFNISGSNTLVNKNDEEEMNFRKRKISPNSDQNKASTEQGNSELMAPPELDIPVQNESTEKVNEKLISKRKRLAENGNSSVKSTTMNNQETSSCNLKEKNDDYLLDLLPCSPPVDSDENMKTEVSRCPPIYERPLKISNREKAFGKFIASELNSLYPYPELFLQAKRSILGILVQAQFELIKSSSGVS